MLKKFIACLILVVVFLFGGCSSPPAIPPDAPPATTPAAELNMGPADDDLYYYYSGKINTGLAEFRGLINSSEDFGPVSTLNIEYRTVLGISTEGARFTRFMTPGGRVVRYTLFVFGETFRAEENYYFFSDGLIYIQSLRMNYADWNFSIANRFDILQYSLNSIVVDGAKAFLIDDSLKQIIKTEEIHFFTLDELNNLFDEGLTREEL